MVPVIVTRKMIVTMIVLVYSMVKPLLITVETVLVVIQDMCPIAIRMTVETVVKKVKRIHLVGMLIWIAMVIVMEQHFLMTVASVQVGILVI